MPEPTSHNFATRLKTLPAVSTTIEANNIGAESAKKQARVEIFQEADLSLGFSEAVSDMIDIEVTAGCPAAPAVMKAILQTQSHNPALEILDSYDR